MVLEKGEFLIGDRDSEEQKNCEKEVVIVWSLGDKPSEEGSLGFHICLHGGARFMCVMLPRAVFGERVPGRVSWGLSSPQACLCIRQPGSVFRWVWLLQSPAKTEETSEDGCALDLTVCLGNRRDTGTSPFRRRDSFLVIFPLTRQETHFC